jgi:hypothetical protein
MIEIIMILFSVFNFFIIFTAPVIFFNRKISYFREINLFDIMILNVIIYINLLLFFSFISLNTKFLFLIISLTGYSFFFFNLKGYLNLIKNNLIIFSLFFFILFCFFIKISYDPILAWDGAHHWLMKSKVFFDGGYIKNIKGVMMDYYPHLGTYLWAFFWKNSYLQIEYFGRFLFIFLFIISFFSCFYNFQTYTGLKKSSLIIVLIYLSTDFMLFKGYQEYLLFFTFYACSRIFIVFERSISNKQNNIIYLLLFGFVTNIFLWTKQEGFFHFFIINAIFLIHSKIKFSYKFYYMCLIAAFIILFLSIKNYFFDTFQFHENILKPNIFENLKPSVLAYKLSLITKYIFISFFKNPIWLAILFCVFLYFKKNKNYLKQRNFFVITFLFFELGLLYVIFLYQDADLKFLLPLTLSRVLFPISGFLIFLINDFFNKSKIFNLKKKIYHK